MGKRDQSLAGPPANVAFGEQAMPDYDVRDLAAADDFYHYLPVNDVAMRWGMYVTGAGRTVVPPGQQYPSPGHPSLYHFEWKRGRTLPEFQIVFISEGQGVFESHETGETEIAPDCILFLVPGVWHRYRPDLNTGWKERWISFNGEIAHRLMKFKLIRPSRAVEPSRQPRQLAQAFDRVLERIHAHPTQNSILLSVPAMALVAFAIEQATGESLQPGDRTTLELDDVHDPVVVQTLELIWTHSHRGLSVDQIARRLPITRRTLDRRFQAATGRSVLEEIHNCRLSRAKRLLAETDLPVKTVAYLAGFSSAERMRVLFLRTENISPFDFRLRSLRRWKTRPRLP
jgi:AraC-like DNA-binding protein